MRTSSSPSSMATSSWPTSTRCRWPGTGLTRTCPLDGTSHSSGHSRAGASRRSLSAVVITVSPARRGQRLSGRMIEAMRDAARAHGLGALLAPVRPTLKARYPLIPIEEFVRWRRPDGSHLDPWIRTHERVGGEILRPAPESMVIEAPVAFEEDGRAAARRRELRRRGDALHARGARRHRQSRGAERLAPPTPSRRRPELNARRRRVTAFAGDPVFVAVEAAVVAHRGVVEHGTAPKFARRPVRVRARRERPGTRTCHEEVALVPQVQGTRTAKEHSGLAF